MVFVGYRFLTYRKSSFQNIKEVVHRIYCYREKYQESNEVLLATNKNYLYSCLSKFLPGFMIFGSSFGLSCGITSLYLLYLTIQYDIVLIIYYCSIVN